MVYTICIMSIVLFALTFPLFAGEASKLEVIVYFRPGLIEFPLDRLETDISEVTIHQSSVSAVFQSHDIQTMRCAIPDFAHSPDLSTFNSRERGMVLALSNAYVVKANNLDDVQSLIDELRSVDGVVLAESNYLGLRACVIPNDPYFDQQWAMNDPIFKADINAPEAWEITTGSDIMVAVLDNGVDAGMRIF